MGLLGRSVLRSEDEKFLLGRGQYVDNLKDERFANALHVVFVKSQVAHGLIKAIDVSDARQMPGVHAVLTAQDIELPAIPPLWGITHPKMFREIVASKKHFDVYRQCLSDSGICNDLISIILSFI